MLNFLPFLAVGGSLLNSANQSRAASRALDAQTAQTDAQIREARRQYDQTRADFEPFRRSDLARRGLADASYGLSAGAGSQVGSNFMQQSGPDYGAYVRNNADLLAAYNASGGQYGGMADFGLTHWMTHGEGEGRQLPMFADGNTETTFAGSGGADSANSLAGAARANNPLAGFQASGDYALLDYAPVRDSVNAAFSAKGMGLDGSALRGQWAGKTAATQDAFYRWRSGLEGSPTGASGALANAGQNYLGSFTNASQNAANARASSYQRQADLFGEGLGSVIGGLQYWGGRGK